MKDTHLILHNDIQKIPQLADFVETIAEEKQLSQSLAMGLNLALEEAVTNVILYAYPDGADGLVDIEAIIKEHSLEFIITDSGIHGNIRNGRKRASPSGCPFDCLIQAFRYSSSAAASS